jgi:hypothetical protein
MSTMGSCHDRARGDDPTHELVGFLTDRLTEDLARIWSRDEVRDPALRRPGMAAQVAAVDDLLRTLAAGRLPRRAELRVLLYGYGDHPAYQAAWTESLSRAG